MSGQVGARLEGKVALVTGAGGGVGRAEARLLAREGARVVVNNHLGSTGSARPSADVVVEEIVTAGGTAVASHDDVTDPVAAERLVATAVDTFGGLDIVVNNAGVSRAAPVESLEVDDWDRVLAVSLRGAFLVCRAAVPALRASGPSTAGVILNTSSESGLGHAYMSAYASAKEGVVGLTRSLARELAASGIRCNAIRPRALGTSMGARFRQEIAPYAEAMAPLGRHRVGDRAGVGGAGSPEEAAPFAVWLCTAAAAGITGHVFSIEGDTVGLWSEPVIERSAAREGGWTLDALDALMPHSVVDGLADRGVSKILAAVRASAADRPA